MSAEPVKGRGACANPLSRFEKLSREAFDDGWEGPPDGAAPQTVVYPETSRSIISRNDSPDIPFSQSVNPYRGCEHGCIYCYARPSHGYLGFSSGLDFETRLVAKTNAAERLRGELAKASYRVAPIALGSNTDPYQPIEREWRLTRDILAVLADHRHPFTIVTKSSLIERDLDLLAPMASQGLAQVFVSIASLDRSLARTLEPRAASPERRLLTVERLAKAGIPTGVLVAPVIPGLTDAHMERVLAAAREAGATEAGYVFVRLPHDVAPLFEQWLDAHYPLKAARVMSLIRESRGGQDNDPRFGARMRGTGIFASLLEQRFRKAHRRLGYRDAGVTLETGLFRVPSRDRQLSLF
ncbi:MAG: PA0069 family radical SAM protein [Betaproteobacteria bacterium]|nr:PA0069 family radical SAM protein [Betaproteobacteria bacterium]